ncbi:pyruvate kinase [Nematocida ausubeli]|nr:pyruvate kinase [Nematocida ausubeli]
MKKLLPSKIICTLGPASSSEEIICKMIDEGMSIARINLSHAAGESSHAVLNMLNHLRENIKYSALSIAMDTKGPEIRTGIVPDVGILINQGDKVVLTTDTKYSDSCEKSKVFIDHKNIYDDLSDACRSIFIDDGKLELEVLSVSKKREEITTQAKNSGCILSRKGVNIPNIKLSLPNLTENDRKSIEFGIQHGVDLIFASFIQRRQDIKDIKKILTGRPNVKIIAKIESTEGLNNLSEIVEEADGVMIARGDLGIETDYSNLFFSQCMIAKECKYQNKPFIVATEILESMKCSLKPTRAEVTDLSFAVLSGAACVMLSGESAVGIDPVNTVRVMHKIVEKSSEAVIFPEAFRDKITLQPPIMKVLISKSVESLRSTHILFGWGAIHADLASDNVQIPNGYQLERVLDEK